ncbi:hypothetical protein [uncultured Roseibium sp.]|uniref:hypothetical protein n=1 Tax=uncultured Roseibium sp. TaxID=1936171 RepID=UPI003216D569
MQITPVPAFGRSNVKRKRPSSGDAEGERRAVTQPNLPVPVQPVHSAQDVPFPDRYHPNSVFLAHLIATRDAERHAPHGWKTVPQFGTAAYRATAALPRKREVGHVISTDY